MIPKEIQEKIEKEAEAFAHDQVFDRNKFRNVLTNVGGIMGEFGYNLAQQEIADKDAEITKLKKEIEGWYRYKENIDQALNTGDGTYRP